MEIYLITVTKEYYHNVVLKNYRKEAKRIYHYEYEKIYRKTYFKIPEVRNRIRIYRRNYYFKNRVKILKQIKLNKQKKIQELMNKGSIKKESINSSFYK